MINDKEYNGHPLFTDTEDRTIRNQNRGRLMANITEDYQEDNRVSRQGMGLLLGYFSKVPLEDRGLVLDVYREELTARNISYAQ